MYRPDLDGLRAVAVSMVIAFHLNEEQVPGGFTGVDVFFVLSGFFITSQIADKLRDGSFTFSDFYGRRVRRILPALVVVLLITTLAAFVILLPEELRQYGRTLTAAVLSVSNLIFWARSDYFAAPAETELLLHTWSLSVEEQFYIIFPACLFLLYRFGKTKIRSVLLVGLLVSFLGSCLLGLSYPDAAFYLLPSRAWELLVGASLALRVVPNATSTSQRIWMGTLGAVLIVSSAFLLSENMVLQVAILVPVAGSALLIWSGYGGPHPEGVACRVLSARPIVFLGRISFGLYLWHWPIIVLARLVWPGEFSALQQATILALTFFGAICSWVFVEQPIRRQAWNWTSGKSLAAAGAMVIATAVVTGETIRGWPPGTLSPQAARLAQGAMDISPFRPSCHRSGRSVETVSSACILGHGKTMVTVFSDSHGTELAAALSEIPEFRVRQLTTSSCSPAGLSRQIPLCGAIVRATLSELVAEEPTIIVLTAAFSFWSRDPQNWPAFEESIAALQALGHAIIVVGDVPPFASATSLPKYLARRTRLGISMNGYDYKVSPGILQSDQEIRGLAARRGVGFVLLDAVLCPEGQCMMTIDGAPVLFDDHHMSMTAARYLVKASGLDLMLRETAKTLGSR
ncbi:MAG: acyltransferase family protein [Hyphomicrobiaceae bacterium]|nr:acyltransferase family protein [Hyphomicrobiaceae bacterium]